MAKSSSKKASKPEQFDPREPLPADAPYFYSLTLENIRCFADKQTLDLSDSKGNAARWTVILGENGTGKTTLLQLLAMFEPQPRNSPIDEGKVYILNYSRGMMNISLALFGHLLRNNIDLTSIEKSKAKSSVSVIKRVIKYQLSFEIIGNTISMPANNYGYEDYILNNLLVYGFGAKRQIGTKSWEEYKEIDSAASLFVTNSALINVADWLRNIKLSATFAKHPERSNKVYDTMINLFKSGLLPGVDDAELRATEEIGGVNIFFHSKDGWIPLESLGLGYQTMIAWTVDFAARMVERYPDSPQPLHEPAIVLVDELDLHLHPRWQREIIGFLTKQFPKTQFIVTAHSPLVVQAAQDVNANIVLLRREGDHVVIDQNVRIDRNLTVDLLLTSDAFGLEALYSPRTEELMREQELLQAKSHLKATEQERLKQIEQEIGIIPITSNPIDNEAMTLIREAAELLKAKNKEKVAKPRSTQTTKSIKLKVKSAGSGAKTPSTQTTKSKKKHNVHGTHS
jgi:AAA15 family ATPase/GTPase